MRHLRPHALLQVLLGPQQTGPQMSKDTQREDQTELFPPEEGSIAAFVKMWAFIFTVLLLLPAFIMAAAVMSTLDTCFPTPKKHSNCAGQDCATCRKKTRGYPR